MGGGDQPPRQPDGGVRVPISPVHRASGAAVLVGVGEPPTHHLPRGVTLSRHSKTVALPSNPVPQQASKTHRVGELGGSRDQQVWVSKGLNKQPVQEAIVITPGHKLQGKVFQPVVGRGMLKNVIWSSNCRVSGKLCSAVRDGEAKM